MALHISASLLSEDKRDRPVRCEQRVDVACEQRNVSTAYEIGLLNERFCRALLHQSHMQKTSLISLCKPKFFARAQLLMLVIKKSPIGISQNATPCNQIKVTDIPEKLIVSM
jgi:hypothetical protein